MGLVLLTSCQQEEVHTYIGERFVQFKEYQNQGASYSFVYEGSEIQRDTFWIDAFCSGGLDETVRTYRLRQKEEYVFSYYYDAAGAIIDSVLVKSKKQAVAGLHYVDFNDPMYLELCKIEGNVVNFKVPVIVLRDDPTLKTAARTLLIEFVQNEDFSPGDPNTKTFRLKISDVVEYPEAWSNYSTRPDVIGRNPYFGDYGKVKHQFMIDVTGKRWDNEFIDDLTLEEKLFYKNMCAKELARVNAERAERGEPPLMENPDNPKSVVKFP